MDEQCGDGRPPGAPCHQFLAWSWTLLSRTGFLETGHVPIRASSVVYDERSGTVGTADRAWQSMSPAGRPHRLVSL